MATNSNDAWHNQHLRARQLEAELTLPNGSIKPEVTGRYSLVFVHMNEDQIRQIAHLWYVLSHIPPGGAAGPDTGHQKPST